MPAREATLDTVLQLEFAAQPKWVVALVRADLAAGCALFQGAPALAKSVLAVVRGVSFDGATPPDWEALLLLLGLIRSALAAPGAATPPEVQAKWEARLAGMENSVRASRVLSRHGFTVPPLVIEKSDGNGLRALLREVVTAAAARAKMRADEGAAAADAAFGKLWVDVRDLHAYGFDRAGPLSKALSELVRAALLAQAWDVAEQCAHPPPVRRALCAPCLVPHCCCTLGSARRRHCGPWWAQVHARHVARQAEPRRRGGDGRVGGR